MFNFSKKRKNELEEEETQANAQEVIRENKDIISNNERNFTDDETKQYNFVEEAQKENQDPSPFVDHQAKGLIESSATVEELVQVVISEEEPEVEVIEEVDEPSENHIKEPEDLVVTDTYNEQNEVEEIDNDENYAPLDEYKIERVLSNGLTIKIVEERVESILNIQAGEQGVRIETTQKVYLLETTNVEIVTSMLQNILKFEDNISAKDFLQKAEGILTILIK